MNILFNLIPIKKGGGQQVASNFVFQLLAMKGIKPYFLVTEGTLIQQRVEELGFPIAYAVKGTLINRFCFENFKLSQIIRKHNIDLIYTLFGPGLFSKGTISITGCAYSNLFFPEIDFWQGLSFSIRIKHKLIDRYRLAATLKSDAIIFENKAMQERAIGLYKFPEEKTKLILPSISEYQKSKHRANSQQWGKLDSQNFNILMLTGWHKNKNINIVPFVLKEIQQQNQSRVAFVLSLSKDHPSSILLLEKAKEFGVDEKIHFIGTVGPNDIPSLMEKIHGVALFSLLESFSNNIIEAWHFKKPLFISDEIWSRAICNKAAIYVDRTNAKDIGAKINFFMEDKKRGEDINKEVELILQEYPNPREKVNLQIEFLKEIAG